MDQAQLDKKEGKLIQALASLDGLIVAYSGGVDSSLLAYYARCVLGQKAKIAIALSPSLAHAELEAARLQAHQFGWDLIEISTNEVDKPEYQRNDPLRCYFCKSTLFDQLKNLATQMGVNSIAYGANQDDLKDFRPGHKAAAEHGVLSPLQDAKLSKEEIRALAQKAGLPSWNRPQAACLSSRFPTYDVITADLLGRVDKAESCLHQLGFSQVRVRQHNDLARIELELNDLSKLSGNTQLMRQIAQQLKALGYAHVALDMEGYRQGSSNKPVPRDKQWTAIS